MMTHVAWLVPVAWNILALCVLIALTRRHPVAVDTRPAKEVFVPALPDDALAPDADVVDDEPLPAATFSAANARARRSPAMHDADAARP